MDENAYDAVVGKAHPDSLAPKASDSKPANVEIGDSTEDDAAQDADEVTGASPGTAQACTDLGLNSLESNLERFGIKPPGMS